MVRALPTVTDLAESRVRPVTRSDRAPLWLEAGGERERGRVQDGGGGVAVGRDDGRFDAVERGARDLLVDGAGRGRVPRQGERRIDVVEHRADAGAVSHDDRGTQQ